MVDDEGDEFVDGDGDDDEFPPSMDDEHTKCTVCVVWSSSNCRRTSFRMQSSCRNLPEYIIRCC